MGSKPLLNGDAPIGFQQVSELIEISGVTVLGEVPDELQKKTGYYICSLRTAATGVDANRFISAVIEARTTNILRALGLSLDEKL
jgi:ABC-type molybdate transport system substrate-binding protein